MTSEKISPHKVTKPIQLLAAWLVGLCVVDGAFLATSTALPAGWLQTSLVIAAIINVPLFIAAIFLLQTKFRPEMQEDEYYSRYLDKKTQKIIELSRPGREQTILEKIEAKLSAIAVTANADKEIDTKSKGKVEPSVMREAFPFGIAINDHLPWFSELRKELRELNYPLVDIFGAANGTAPPCKFIIGIGKHLPISSVRNVLKILLKYEFDGVELFRIKDDFEPRDVFIGGYGYEGGYAPITDELRSLVDTGIEKVDFEHYIKIRLIKPNNADAL